MCLVGGSYVFHSTFYRPGFTVLRIFKIFLSSFKIFMFSSRFFLVLSCVYCYSITELLFLNLHHRYISYQLSANSYKNGPEMQGIQILNLWHCNIHITYLNLTYFWKVCEWVHETEPNFC